jgi:hypothetical protein
MNEKRTCFFTKNVIILRFFCSSESPKAGVEIRGRDLKFVRKKENKILNKIN